MPDLDENALQNALGRLIFEIFRVNGRLLAAGDELVAPLGLTSARWQVLWAMAIAPEPQPVAHLARTMGLNRQGVQRIVNEMVEAGIVTLHENPHHKRAKLVVFTPRGEELYGRAEELRRPWLHGLAQGGAVGRFDAVADELRRLRERLAEAADSGAS